MRRATVALLSAAAVVALGGGAASAHRLKLFAASAGNTVSGYGFFVGGGRAGGAPVIARDAAGRDLWRGTTGDDGTFAFDVTASGPITVTLDAGDGHAAETTLATGADPAPESSPTPAPAPAAAGHPDAHTLAPLLAAEIDRAVARQIRPLLEASAAAEARIRVNDVLGGLGWIIGLVGTALFVLSRKRR